MLFNVYDFIKKIKGLHQFKNFIRLFEAIDSFN